MFQNPPPRLTLLYMAELLLRPLLAHTPEKILPGTRRLFLLPLLLALVGIIVAASAARAGQQARRTQDLQLLTLKHQNLLLQLEDTRDPATRARLAAELQAARPSDINLISYLRPGRYLTWWDAYRYEEIIDAGYVYNRDDDSTVPVPGPEKRRLKNVTWYPLYPLLGYALKSATGLSARQALTMISWASILGAAVIFFALARRHYFNRMAADPAAHARPLFHDLHPADTAALWALTFLLFGPAAIFLYANFTESLFVLLLASFLYLLQSRRWLAAAVIAGLASACRSQGVLFAPVLVAAYLLRGEKRDPARYLPFAGLLALVSLAGILSYMGFLWYRFDDPLALMYAQRYWNVGFRGETLTYTLNPVNALSNFVKYLLLPTTDYPRLWESFCVIAPPILLMLLGARFLSFELELIGWLLWGVPYISNALGASDAAAGHLHWMSMGRFMAVALPLQVILGAVVLRFRWLGPPLLALSAAAFALFAYWFGAGAWVG